MVETLNKRWKVWRKLLLVIFVTVEVSDEDCVWLAGTRAQVNQTIISGSKGYCIDIKPSARLDNTFFVESMK